MRAKISASIICADLTDLKTEIRNMEIIGVDYIHIDVMDGHFVANLGIGPDCVQAIRSLTDISLDIHLMVEKPENFIDLYKPTPNDLVCVHQESTVHLERVIQMIKSKGAKAGVAINPATPVLMLEPIIEEIDVVLIMTVNPGFTGQKMVPCTLKKIYEVKKMITDAGLQVEIEVDGNVSFENAQKMRKMGADIFVVGTSSLFNPQVDRYDAAYKLKQILSA